MIDVVVMTKEEFQQTINKMRLDNRGHWFQWTGEVEGRKIELKCYNTWLQIFRVDGVDHGNVMDQNVGAFKAHLLTPFEPVDESGETGTWALE